MAEKGETKILVIITICVILISILLSGCIESDNDDKKVTEENDLVFSIESDKLVINSSSPSLNLSFILKNLSNNSIRIFSWFDINTTISVQLSNNLNNYTYGNLHIYLLKANFTFIKPYQTKIYKINIKNIRFINLSNDSEGIFNYNIPGNYTLVAFYNFEDLKPWLISNELQIEII
jgi:hypothetical protein